MAAALAWGVLTALGVTGPSGSPLAAAQTAPYLATEVSTVAGALRDRGAFQQAMGDDPFGGAGSGDLATPPRPHRCASSSTRRPGIWGWQPGLRPDPTGPVWRMDAFRDRFLTGFSSGTSHRDP